VKKCQYCGEEVQDEAVICRFCGRDLIGLSSETLGKNLEKAIGEYTALGWVLISRTEHMAQLKLPKPTYVGCFFISLVLSFFLIFPIVLYLILYAVQKEPVITLTVGPDGRINTPLPEKSALEGKQWWESKLPKSLSK